uniref:Uncharacterized protein n=1 Tax=Acrobeloides nanus TaxID=290746 RepID=A0A914D5E1_9BILA
MERPRIALDRDLLMEIFSNFIRNPNIKRFGQLSAEPFRLYLVNRSCNRCMLSLLWNYPTVSIFSNTAALDSKHDDPSSSHERIDMDHNILEYFLKLNPHFVKE